MCVRFAIASVKDQFWYSPTESDELFAPAIAHELDNLVAGQDDDRRTGTGEAGINEPSNNFFEVGAPLKCYPLGFSSF
jgi:hypothetical protein